MSLRPAVLLLSLFAVTLALMPSVAASNPGKQHPTLVLTADDVVLIQQRKDVPSFDLAIARLHSQVAQSMAKPIDVPQPADAGGGYTHEQHKRNYQAIYGAGFLYQISGEEKYLEHARALFMAYADLYPSLGEHPKKKEQSPGRLFWQSLNETVFLVHAIQGYDAILPGLSQSDRDLIEKNVLRPMATFLSEESPATFNKVHNHGTWAVAGVGMTGYVLGDQELVEKALYGLDKSGKAGFLKQLDELFSPDGYYTEGPYYQRYALMPFVIFAKAIDNNEPQRGIFEYRDRILLKAIYATIQLSYNDLFFPINDALKDKGIDTIELVHGIAIAYGITRDPQLLSVAQRQHTLSISGDGLALAQGIDAGETQPFDFKSLLLKDGARGAEGALAILRAGPQTDSQTVVVKNTSQGMGHGHFDRLNWLYYDNGHEIIRDYGAARFLNIESKYGGHYLPENNAYAKQTVAHNTLVVDETSHFAGDWRMGQKYAPELLFFDVTERVKITSARTKNAYPDVTFERTMALVSHPWLEFPLIIDVLKTESKTRHQYDLPVHFNGHITDLNLRMTANAEKQTPLSQNNGYQYLWHVGTGTSSGVPAKVTWLNANRFYTLTMAESPNQSFLFTQVGANDPNFNLRPEPAIIQRVTDTANHTFLSVLETHGEYNPSLEFTLGSHSNVTNLSLGHSNGIDLATISLDAGKQLVLAIATFGDSATTHTIELNGRTLKWTGHYTLFENLQ